MIKEMLCELGVHDYTRWEMRSGTQWEGLKPKEVSMAYRECIRCGLPQVKRISFGKR